MEKIEGRGAATVWGTQNTLPMKGAIFLNAYTSALFDMDDGHRKAQGHPGAVLVPAAITVGTHLSSSGKEILEAVAVGYDVAVREAVRIREAGGPRKGSSGWCAPGAAATIGKLLKLTDEQMANAIGLAEYFTPQAGQDRSVNFPSMMKEGIPWGAYTGSFCAHLASGGFTAHRPHLADSELCNDLGQRVEVDYAYYKKWSACRWAHPALFGLETCKSKTEGFNIAKVKHVQIRTFEKATLMTETKPANTLKAVYAIPFCIAYWLKYGQVDPEDLLDEQKMISDPEVLDMAKRVDLEHAPEYTEEFPLRCIQDVTVTWAEGGDKWTSGPMESPGDPGERAFSDEEMVAKFQKLTEPLMGPKWKEVADMILTLDEVADITALTKLLATV
jgi:2-methylcitrate dehydratase PrpD